MELGLVELLLVFTGVLGLAIWDLLATRRTMGTVTPSESTRPPKATAVKQKAESRRPSASKARRAKSVTASR